MNNYFNLGKERGMNTLAQKFIKSLIVLTMIVGSAATAFTNNMLTVSAADNVVEITEGNFPDPVVRELMESLDTDDSGWLDEDEIAAAPTTITVIQASDLTGLDYLTSVARFNINDFQGEILDLTDMSFPALTAFQITGFAIKNIELSDAIPNLRRLWVIRTSMVEMDFSHISTLNDVYLATNLELKKAVLAHNSNLTEIQILDNPILEYLDVRNSPVHNFNVSHNPNLGVIGFLINDAQVAGAKIVMFDGTKTVDAFYEMFASATEYRALGLWDATSLDEGYAMLHFETVSIPLFKHIKLSDLQNITMQVFTENEGNFGHKYYYVSSNDTLVFEPQTRSLDLGGGVTKNLPDMIFTIDSEGYITSIKLEVSDVDFIPPVVVFHTTANSYRLQLAGAILQPGVTIGLGLSGFSYSLFPKNVDGHNMYNSIQAGVPIVWDAADGVYKGAAGTNEYVELTVVFDGEGNGYFERDNGTKYVPVSSADKQKGNLPEHEIVVFDKDADGNEVVVGVNEENYGYVADDGTIYVSVDTDDGAVLEKYTSNGDHSYTQVTTDGTEGKTVIIVEDELLTVEPQEDGTFIDPETGDIYIADQNGDWIVMDDSGVISFPNGDTLSLADIENCTTQAELDAIKALVDTMIDCGIKDRFLEAIDAKQDEFDYAAARALVDALFTDGTHSELATGVTPADIAAAQVAADKVDNVARNSELDALIDDARVLLAKGIVDDLFAVKYTAIKDTTMGYDIAAARVEVEKIVDPIEKARQTILVNRAQALFNERFNVNLDKDGNGIPDTNIDYDGDGIADINVDTDGDGVADWNLVQDSDSTGLNYDSNGDGFPDLNIDVDADGIADVNIDTDGDGIADVNIDYNLDGILDYNIDTDGDLIPDLNVIDYTTVIGGMPEYKGSGDVKVEIGAPFMLFGDAGKVIVNGVELTEGVHYEVTGSGTTVITLKDAYLKTLANGTYDVEIVFGNGESTGVLPLKVSKSAAVIPVTPPSAPHTGVDGGSMLPWVALMAASAGSITFLAKKKKTDEAVEAEVE